MDGDTLAAEFKALYTAWADAIAEKRYEWLEDFFTEDLLDPALADPARRQAA